MELVLSLLVIQGVMGAFDNLWHHEITERLPQKPSARGELALHSIRAFLYGIIFLALGWSEWHGGFAVLLTVMLIVEVVVTLWDFIIEDMTRKLPKLERVLHTLLAMNYGAVLTLLLPILWAWTSEPTAILPAGYGWLSWIMTLYSVGIFAWAIRDGLAVWTLGALLVPTWRREPFAVTPNDASKTVLVTGGTGFIGRALCRHLIERGDKLIVLTRDTEKAEDLFGPHALAVTDLDGLGADTMIDAVVNLAGAPVLGLPWTARRKATLLDSRIGTTNRLLKLMRRLNKPPEVLINASAVGYYGATGDVPCDETRPPQDVFMSELCRRWEETALEAHKLGVRVCLLRLGLVLGRGGGPLPGLAMPVRFGLGAVLGSGTQWMPWVHLDDVIAFVDRAMADRALSGPFNITAPGPVPNREFTQALGKVLGRPVLFRVPAWPLRALMGEMSDLLLEGQRTVPANATAAGFRFRFTDLGEALKDLLQPRLDAITVHYNEACPVCNAEIEHYRRAANENDAPVAFSAIGRHPGALIGSGVTDPQLKHRMHVSTAGGRIASGADAFIAIWRRLPGYRRLATVVALPGIRQLASAAYEWGAVPSLAAYNAWRERRAPRAPRHVPEP